MKSILFLTFFTAIVLLIFFAIVSIVTMIEHANVFQKLYNYPYYVK